MIRKTSERKSSLCSLLKDQTNHLRSRRESTRSRWSTNQTHPSQNSILHSITAKTVFSVSRNFRKFNKILMHLLTTQTCWQQKRICLTNSRLRASSILWKERSKTMVSLPAMAAAKTHPHYRRSSSNIQFRSKNLASVARRRSRAKKEPNNAPAKCSSRIYSLQARPGSKWSTSFKMTKNDFSW